MKWNEYLKWRELELTSLALMLGLVALINLVLVVKALRGGNPLSPEAPIEREIGKVKCAILNISIAIAMLLIRMVSEIIAG